MERTDSQRSFHEEDKMDDLGIITQSPLLPPQILQIEHPLSLASKQTISRARKESAKVLSGKDDRLIIIVGPCSIHDTVAAIEYGNRLLLLKQELKDDLIIIMRAYFEKPRTTVGWKGLINDPDINGSFEINKGLRIARKLLVELTDMGLPVGVELLDTISPQFIADCVSWVSLTVIRELLVREQLNHSYTENWHLAYHSQSDLKMELMVI
jgi:3-deoxy-7-phosphoheptulonate synthase